MGLFHQPIKRYSCTSPIKSLHMLNSVHAQVFFLKANVYSRLHLWISPGHRDWAGTVATMVRFHHSSFSFPSTQNPRHNNNIHNQPALTHQRLPSYPPCPNLPSPFLDNFFSGMTSDNKAKGSAPLVLCASLEECFLNNCVVGFDTCRFEKNLNLQDEDWPFAALRWHEENIWPFLRIK